MEIENKIPKSCKVVVIGGGVAGCSTAYHLAKYGWKDTVLLERDILTSGTTWHAAGLIGQLGSSATITKLRNNSLNLYKKLEEETGLSTGLKQNGSLTVATTSERLEELNSIKDIQNPEFVDFITLYGFEKGSQIAYNETLAAQALLGGEAGVMKEFDFKNSTFTYKIIKSIKVRSYFIKPTNPNWIIVIK